MNKGKLIRNTVLGSAVSAMALTAGLTAPVQAQIDEIIVTAQRRPENLQRVPISVTAVSGEKFDSMFLAGDDILALAARVPSLYAESSNGRVAPRFYIRGLGNTDFDLAASQPVSIIMDDVVLENVVLKSSPIFDIEQVEVLRGPQGTLFGRNTPAGIVKFTTRKPTHEFDAYGTVSYGTYGNTTLEGAVGGSLSEGVLAARGSFLYQKRDDYIDNTFTGQSDALGGFHELAGRIQLLWTPSDDLSVLLNAHGRSLEGTAAIFRANILTTGSNSINGNFDRDSVAFDGGINNPQEYDGYGGSANVSYEFGGVTLTSITAYETTDGFSRGDIDGGNPAGPGFIPFQSDTQDSIDDLDQFTQEIRLASQDTDGYSWQIGAYYFDSEFTITTNPFFVAPSTLTHENTAWAVFGQGTVDVTEQFRLTAGIRFTSDEKDLTVLASPFPIAPVSVSDEQVSWDLSATYFVNDDVSVYGRIASGFRGPTIQGRDVAFFGTPSTAKSETIISYEGGVKSELWEDRARINLAAYYWNMDDIQISAVGGAGNLIQLVNAQEAVGFGFEADAEFLISENFLMTFGLSYNDTEIQDPNLLIGVCGSGQCTPLDPTSTIPTVPFPTTVAAVDGNPLPNAPEVIVNVTARYGMPVGPDHEMFFFTDWSYQGDTNVFLYDSIEYKTDGQFEGGLKLGYRRNDGAYELAFYARNITDEVNLKGGIDFNNNTGFVNEPRVVGFTFTARR